MTDRPALSWPFAALDCRHAALIREAADLPWEDGQSPHARACAGDGWIHFRRGRARLRILDPFPESMTPDAFIRAAVGPDARVLWPALAEQVLMAEGGRLFLHDRPLPSTIIYGVAIIPVVGGDPVRWARAARLLRLPDPRRPTDLLPLPAWIHVKEPSKDGSAHLRLHQRAALDAHGLRPLDGRPR